MNKKIREALLNVIRDDGWDIEDDGEFYQLSWENYHFNFSFGVTKKDFYKDIKEYAKNFDSEYYIVDLARMGVFDNGDESLHEDLIGADEVKDALDDLSYDIEMAYKDVMGILTCQKIKFSL